MLHLERWAADHDAFMERNSDLYAELLAVYDLICFRTVRVLKSSAEIYGAIMEDSLVEPNDWQALDQLSTRHSAVSQLQLAAQTAAGCMLEDLRKDMDSLLNNLLLYAARAALAGEWTLGRSRKRLGAIGFTLEPAPPGIVKFVAVAAGFAFVWCLVWLLGSGKVVHTPGDQYVGMMRTLLMTPLYLIVNFWLVYYFKRQYAFANETIFGRLPIGFILTIGLWSALILFPIQAAFDFYQFPQRPYLDVVLHELPILIFPWGIAAMAALLVQDFDLGQAVAQDTADARWPRLRRRHDGAAVGAAGHPPGQPDAGNGGRRRRLRLDVLLVLRAPDLRVRIHHRLCVDRLAARGGRARPGQKPAYRKSCACQRLTKPPKNKTPPFAAGSRLGGASPTGARDVNPDQAGMRSSTSCGSRST